MGLFKHWLGMSFCKCSTTVTNWRISRTERNATSFGATLTEELLCIVLIITMVILVIALTLPNQKREAQKSQQTATAPTISADSQLIENLKKTNSDLLETIGILQGNLSRLMEIRKGANTQIAGLKKDLEKAQDAIKTLTVNYETKLKTAN